MKVGDLVSLKMKKTLPPQEACHGIVLDMFLDYNLAETADVLWETGRTSQLRPNLLEVISETR
tara:strand:- start:2904 stop:3092 length:189 start_codon:yes stop_codon:yes gene_type:complete